ncbi:MAG: radical SAM protein [Ruminococcaceae bacterium]|nr:radical SAM protein [Oscillospiraceae bacterium]
MSDNERTLTAPVITFSRLRMQSDGQGVTTLVCFHGCPLRCKYCINSFSFDPDTKYEKLTPEDLYKRVKIDELYFLATNGGVTFGGGEPLLYSEFIKEFRNVCGEEWHLCAETSLNVPWENVKTAAECIDMFYIDCKDTNSEIYMNYTGKDNSVMLENLERLVKMIGTERIVVRLPLIPEYNTEEDREKSREILDKIGIKQYDFFAYKTAM